MDFNTGLRRSSRFNQNINPASSAFQVPPGSVVASQYPVVAPPPPPPLTYQRFQVAPGSVVASQYPVVAMQTEATGPPAVATAQPTVTSATAAPIQAQVANPPDINKELNDLAVFDTIHDFWKERKKAKNDDEDEDNVELDETKLNQIRIELLNFLINFKEYQSISSINDLLNKMSGSYITSATSKYENTVRSYYEKKSSIKDELYEDTIESLTYGDIIESYEAASSNPANNKLLQKYINSSNSNYILELNLGKEPKYSSFGIIEKNPKHVGYIANFILNYFFPGKTSDAHYFTFDAKSGILNKLFRNFDNVYQMITPANIADSAYTSFKTLKNRNYFTFPKINDKWTFNSNYYTKTNNYSIYFTESEKGFTDKNQYGFKMNVEIPTRIFQFPFSSAQTSGPSVNYLIDLILSTRNIDKPKSILDVNQLSSITNTNQKRGLLFDLKRCGDYEQVNMAKYLNSSHNVILSTIDILCSLYARIQKQNNILQYNEKLTLYRFIT